jgi:hypothetical protein
VSRGERSRCGVPHAASRAAGTQGPVLERFARDELRPRTLYIKSTHYKQIHAPALPLPPRAPPRPAPLSQQSHGRPLVNPAAARRATGGGAGVPAPSLAERNRRRPARTAKRRGNAPTPPRPTARRRRRPPPSRGGATQREPAAAGGFSAAPARACRQTRMEEGGWRMGVNVFPLDGARHAR